MRQIPRIRPQSKRRALSAKAFAERYSQQAIDAAYDGNETAADDYYAKSQYWRERYEYLVARGALG